MKTRMNKAQILERIDSKDILEYYLQHAVPDRTIKTKGNFQNPFLDREQKTPSFNIYQARSGEWRFKDFSSGADMEGDCFDFVMRYYRETFSESLERIATDFGLNSRLEPVKPSQTSVFSVSKRLTLTPNESAYWSQYGISTLTLEKLNVYSLSEYRFQNAKGKQITVKANDDKPIFAYEINPNCYKLYQPFSEPKFKFRWLGEKPAEYVFGLDQIPERGELVFLTGGEKDVLSLQTHGYPAVCLNSETANPSKEFVAQLKSRFEKVIVLYDLDETGRKRSAELVQEFSLYTLELPNEMFQQNLGKDISDYFKCIYQEDSPAFASYEQFDALIEEALDKGVARPEIKLDTPLGKMLGIAKKVHRIMQGTIEFPPPILSIGEQPVIYSNTINIIQGKSGTHKSRVAETICAALLRNDRFADDPIGLKVNSKKKLAVAYVDTERNLNNQLPFALRTIIKNANFSPANPPLNFMYTSLLEFPREERPELLNGYLNHVRQLSNRHLVVILDVITDCIQNFNNVNESMALVDTMNRMINNHDVTFLTIIHENPGAGFEKARGHLGTELFNKASTVMQVSFEKDGNNTRTDLIKLAFPKCRATASPTPILLQYSKELIGLALADEDAVKTLEDAKRKKAPLTAVSEFIEAHLEMEVSAKEFTEDLSNNFACSRRLIEQRLSELIAEKVLLKNKTGDLGFLVRKGTPKDRVYCFSRK